ncbi:MAG: hypothetical protein KTR13_01995 [Saprospiraceae bacterium]|nr:hypothetical protein [Saprospiraceae bacterium]
MKKTWVIALSIFALYFVTACSDDDNTSDPNTLLPRQSLADEDQTLTRYTVNGDVKTFDRDYEVDPDIVSYREDKALHTRMFERFTGIVPSGRRQFVKQFTPFHGGDVIAGYVYPLNGSNRTEWNIGLDVLTMEVEEASIQASINNPNQDPNYVASFTTIHEYGHLLSLFADELDLNATNCTNFESTYGCLVDDAILQAYYDEFWAADYDEYLTVLGQVGQDGISDAWYDRDPSAFTTRYAATDPQEDFSESFAWFVFRNPPTENTIEDQKLNFFYDYLDLVALRTTMRQYIINNIAPSPAPVPVPSVNGNVIGSALNVNLDDIHRQCGLKKAAR